MEQIVSALITVLVNDVHIVMRVKYVYKCLNSLHVQTLKLGDLLRQTHYLLKLNPQRLQVHFLMMTIVIFSHPSFAAFCLAKVCLKQSCMAIEYQLLDFVAPQKGIN